MPDRETTMQPAATREEWVRGVTGPAGTVTIAGEVNIANGSLFVGPDDMVFDGKERHALAAFALYGQPFGFTREDVEALRAEAYARHDDDGKRLASLADRIAALLPPE